MTARTPVQVGNEGDFGVERIDAGDLADHADVVHHRTARLDAVGEALVDDDATRERVAHRVDHLGDARIDLHPLAHVEQRAQPGVLLVQLFLAQPYRRQFGVFASELRVFRLQPGEVGEVLTGRTDAGHRHAGGNLQRRGHHRQRLAHQFEVMQPVVDHDKRERSAGQQHEAHERRRAAPEERRWGMSGDR